MKTDWEKCFQGLSLGPLRNHFVLLTSKAKHITHNFFSWVAQWPKFEVKYWKSPSCVSVKKAEKECCFKTLSGKERLKSVPSLQQRSWWRTLTGAQSLSASPWCLCRSLCRQASIYSTSPESVKRKYQMYCICIWNAVHLHLHMQC